MILPDNDNNHLKIASRKGNNVKFDNRDLGLANWVFEHEKSAGYSTDTLSSSKWYYLPLSAHKSRLGVLAVAPYKSDITNEQKHLLNAYTSIVSIALANYLKK
jgi:two-component system sensor histidine kinase KdpD